MRIAENYKDVLFNNKQIMHTMKTIRSEKHQLGSYKTSLSCFDERPGNFNLRSSSDSLLLATPAYRSRVTLGDRSFQVAAPALWNVLPREIRSMTDLWTFKCHLKTHLFKEAFID